MQSDEIADPATHAQGEGRPVAETIVPGDEVFRFLIGEAGDVEILQKVMVAILKSRQLRDVLVYTTFLLVFTTAWVSYRWPAVTIPAIVIACILLSVEALLIYLAIKRLRQQEH